MLRIASVLASVGACAWMLLPAAAVSVSGCDTECDCSDDYTCTLQGANGMLGSSGLCEGSQAEAEQTCFDACLDIPECVSSSVEPACGGGGTGS